MCVCIYVYVCGYNTVETYNKLILRLETDTGETSHLWGAEIYYTEYDYLNTKNLKAEWR
jgi:hypothetical protein